MVFLESEYCFKSRECISSAESEDVIELIKSAEQDPKFRIEQSQDQRSLYMPFAMNRKISLLTEKGLNFLIDTIIKLAKVNCYSAFNLLPVFSQLEKLEPKHQARIVEGLHRINDELNEKEHASVYNNIKRILNGCPKAVAEWESANSRRGWRVA